MLKRVIWWSVVLSLLASPAWAETPLETLQKYRGAYPTPMTSAQLGALLNQVAWIHRADGFGLLSKTTGRMCIAPAGWPIACDILTQKLSSGFVTHFDVLIDSDGAATPFWNELGIVDSARFIMPTDPLNGPLPTPQPPPPPPPTIDLKPITDQLARLEQVLGQIQGAVGQLDYVNEHLSALQDQLGVLASMVHVLQARSLPIYRGKILGFPVVFRPDTGDPQP